MGAAQPPLGDPRAPRDPTDWKPVHIWSMDNHEHNHFIVALLKHLDCTVESRWQEGKGVEWRLRKNDEG